MEQNGGREEERDLLPYARVLTVIRRPTEIVHKKETREQTSTSAFSCSTMASRFRLISTFSLPTPSAPPPAAPVGESIQFAPKTSIKTSAIAMLAAMGVVPKGEQKKERLFAMA